MAIREVDSIFECGECELPDEIMKPVWVTGWGGIQVLAGYRPQLVCVKFECPEPDSDGPSADDSNSGPPSTGNGRGPTGTGRDPERENGERQPPHDPSFPDVVPELVKAVHDLRDRQFELINAEIKELGLFEPPRIWSMPKPFDFLEEFRSGATVPAIDVPIPEPNYTRNSAQPWKEDVEVQRLRAAVEAALPPLQRVVEGSDEMTVAARGLATAWNQDAVPALQRVVDPIHNVKGGFDELIGGLMVTGQSSAELREALPANAEAMGHGVYHGLEPAKVGFQELTGGMSDLFDMSLKMPVVGKKLSSLLYGSLRHGGTPESRSGGTDSDGENSGQEPDPVSYDKALDHYQQTSRQSAENIAWMRANPDEEIATGPNKGWTFRELMRDHVEKRGGVPGFAMGGVVPGPVGVPVPAILHGGERVLRSGQAGGGPVNVCLHVHGAVLSERELVRSVREGLIRLNREVTEMGF